MAQFRAKKLDLGCFVNVMNMRDHTKRKVFEQNEVQRQALRYMARNTSLPQRTRAQAQLELSQMHCYTRATQIKNRCIAGGKGRGVLRDFRMARVSSLLLLLSLPLFLFVGSVGGWDGMVRKRIEEGTPGLVVLMLANADGRLYSFNSECMRLRARYLEFKRRVGSEACWGQAGFKKRMYIWEPSGKEEALHALRGVNCTRYRSRK